MILLNNNTNLNRLNFFRDIPKGSVIPPVKCEPFIIMKKIVLNVIKSTSQNYKKFVALVDDEDFAKLSESNWCVTKSHGNLYAVALINDKMIRMHHLIMGFRGADHIDGNGLNNQRANLRKATVSQNNMNREPNKNSTSKYKGVSWSAERNKWLSQIRFNGKGINLGRFVSQSEAAKAYNKKAKELFGEFAKLNIIHKADDSMPAMDILRLSHHTKHQ